jgi:hypothetical protein
MNVDVGQMALMEKQSVQAALRNDSTVYVAVVIIVMTLKNRHYLFRMRHNRSFRSHRFSADHVLGLAVSAVVAMLAILLDLAREITRQETDATHGGLSISHHAVEPIAIADVALLVLLQKGMEFLVAGEVTDFPQPSSSFHNACGFEQGYNDLHAIFVQSRRFGNRRQRDAVRGARFRR